MNITLDDTSPQWLFTSKNGTNTWGITHVGDNQTPNYYSGTFHGTYTDGDTATLKFNGSAIAIYGAFRDNHGLYSSQIDGGDLLYQLGYSQNGKVQQILYSQAGLSTDKEHTVTLVNLPSQTDPPGNATIQWWLDIDYAVITTAETGKIYTTRYDDTSSFVNYVGTGWGTGPPLEPQNYHNTTAHITPAVGDSFSLKFNGSSIQVFGGLYVDHGNYTVSLDGTAMGNYNGTWFKLATQTSLFAASHLADGPHEIVFTNIGNGVRGTYFDFDYAIVNSTIDPTAQSGNSTGTDTSGSTVTPPPVSSSSGSKSNTGAIAGGVVGGVLGLALIGVLIWWLLRRKKRNDTGYGEETRAYPVDLNGEEVKPYTDPRVAENTHMAAGDAYTAPSAYSNLQSYSSPATTGHDNYSPTTMAPQTPHQLPILTIPPPPASNATSYPHSINPPSSIESPSPIAEGNEYVNPFTAGANTPPHVSLSSRGASRQQRQGGLFSPTPIPGISSIGTNSTGASSTTGNETSQMPQTPPRTTKTPGATLPFTARRPTDSTDLSSSDSHSVLLQNRLQRDGREMDMGPILHEGDEEVHQYGSLPPDYQQATEPLPGQRANQHRE